MTASAQERAVGADYRINMDSCERLLVPDDHGASVAARDDAAWFEAHPGVDLRLRPPTAGEVATLPIEPGWVVIVHQIAPGIRHRVFRDRAALAAALREARHAPA